MSVEDQLFLSRVVPWPAPGEPGYINIHWRRPGLTDPKRLWWSGKPTTNLTEFNGQIAWGLQQSSVKDIFFCMSRQAVCGKTTNGFPTPIRNIEGALAVKALWIDVDVKAPPKGYPDTGTALEAVLKFTQAYNLPKPSAIVASGSGGIHVYWISDRVLTIPEWQPYADGLKAAMLQFGLLADHGLTTDPSRVLRVPSTFNWKSDPPKPTKLLGNGPEYNFENQLHHLTTIAPAVTTPASGNGKHNPLPLDPKIFPKRNTVVTESLGDGLQPERKLLQLAPLVKKCGFIRTALATGGKDYTQPLWNLTTLTATFLENGNAVAHALGSQHPGYDRESTEALWDRKLRERKDRGLGWPSCRKIAGEGAAACRTCPLLSLDKHPLSFTEPVAEEVPAQTQATAAPDITVAVISPGQPIFTPPPEYTVNAKGWPCKNVERAEARRHSS